jgi:hypothetical protein
MTLRKCVLNVKKAMKPAEQAMAGNLTTLLYKI